MSAPPDGRPSAVVAVLTFRRPDDLRAVLPQVAAQAARSSARARVLVVDNDPGASGAALVAELDLPGVVAVVEPTPGIAAARNRALDEAAGDDLLVFLDDDERPCDDWLELLLATRGTSGAGAVVGPVVSTFPAELDPWVVAGGFFTRRRLPTGTRVDVAATNNLLLDLAQVRRADVRFDERFGLSGGSDTLFTRSLHAAGVAMVWCDEAVVTDVVPVQRTSRRWVVRRQLRSGNSWSRTEVALARTPGDRLRARLRCAARGGVRLAGGAAGALAGVLRRDLGLRARGVKALARGAGMAGGALGWTYVEYRRSTPRTTGSGD
ncbi:glycosyltransferase [Pseudokineococcus sp. 5B2Z-1]|uniref:glycosyltransferase family 2 protein n=1 Tax=Pseudokineococcus sp. 5B2Z-1 TaxID=3132744 RepID=UPI003097DAFA